MTTTNDLHVTSLSHLKSKLFHNRQSDDKLENAKLINGLGLYNNYKPKYNDPNKKALLEDIHKQNYTPSDKRQILITRFLPRQLPKNYTSEQHNQAKPCLFTHTVFDYELPKETDVTEWHMNFANCDIFGYYDGSLLAQDELQVLECPQLASLREYLLQQNPTNSDGKVFDRHVIENNSTPYPILISNIERVISLDTVKLYGNKFSTSPTSTVLASYKYLEQPQIVNIIAIEAPKYGRGRYTTEQINYILQACYTAYSAAKNKQVESFTYELNKGEPASTPLKTNIHTGWFGCGAYGGNRIIMIVLQILAANMAGIDQLIFHTVKNDCEQTIKSADEFLKKIFTGDQKELSIDELIEKIVNENYRWGLTNGT